MKETYAMSWKPLKRTLEDAPKVKLMYGHPLPENVDDVASVNDFTDVEQNHFEYQGSGSCAFPGFYSSPLASQTAENSYLDSLDKTLEYDQYDDYDLEHMLFSDDGSDDSSLGNSGASLFSWAEGLEGGKNKDVFKHVEKVLYGEESDIENDEELSNECKEWKKSFVHLRVLGKKPCCPEATENIQEVENEHEEDDVEEIIASHGFIEESTERETCAGREKKLPPHSALPSGNLTEQVKVNVLEQLTFYAFSEALKSFEQDHHGEQAEVGQNSGSPPIEDAASTLANLSDDLGRALQISGRSIHRFRKAPNSEVEKKTLISNNPDHVEIGVQSKRFLSNINVIPEEKNYNSPENSFSVLGVPKPLNSEFFSTKSKMLEKRGFHSAADRKRPSILDRRFSCISPEHDKLLKPYDENERVEGSSLVVNSKQISAPNTPLKLLRHLTLPPIQNLNSYNKLSKKLEERDEPSLTHIRRIFVKNKVSLSPLPNPVNIPEEGLSELQLAKRLLNSTPDRKHWSSCRKIGFPGLQNVKSKKKSIDK